MMMVCVWGGGVYVFDVFMIVCDEYGIFVWYDFMFVCIDYFGDDEEFMFEVCIEVDY